MKSNYLLIDYGNSYIKAAIYNPNLKKIVKVAEQPITINPKPILAKLNLLKPGKVSKIIESATANCKYVAPFNKQLKQLLKLDVKVLTFKDFKDDLKIKPPLKGKEMGTDLLCFAYYLKQFKNRSVIFSFGTVYLCFVCSNSSPYDCQFIPSISKGLKRISSQTAIAKSFIPFNTYKDTKGYSTYSCFQAGADNSMYA
ncbi:MAG: type III pantothenate kinase [Mycoplasmoidaceae bacterium]|nr:type III pantothenate kinase [Mycoplasmoidaceae bacterium]